MFAVIFSCLRSANWLRCAFFSRSGAYCNTPPAGGVWRAAQSSTCPAVEEVVVERPAGGAICLGRRAPGAGARWNPSATMALIFGCHYSRRFDYEPYPFATRPHSESPTRVGGPEVLFYFPPEAADATRIPSLAHRRFFAQPIAEPTGHTAHACTPPLSPGRGAWPMVKRRRQSTYEYAPPALALRPCPLPSMLPTALVLRLQLGLGAASTRLTPTHNPFLSNVGGGVVSVSAGANHSVCAVASGWVMSWGHAEYNQQGVAGEEAFFFRRTLPLCHELRRMSRRAMQATVCCFVPGRVTLCRAVDILFFRPGGELTPFWEPEGKSEVKSAHTVFSYEYFISEGA